VKSQRCWTFIKKYKILELGSKSHEKAWALVREYNRCIKAAGLFQDYWKRIIKNFDLLGGGIILIDR
jgi:hypothetical protein